MNKPRLLIEEWLPAQAIGIECLRENSTGLHPPPNRLHVWWARRPLTVSRAAVLASLLPADFDRDCFERLLGFYALSSEIIATANLLANKNDGEWVKQGHGKRAFSNNISGLDILKAHKSMRNLWGQMPIVLDPMAGGGSIPLEAARFELNVLANEYNPVACSVLEATLDYPFRFGDKLVQKAKKYANEWIRRFDSRMKPCYAFDGLIPPRDYIFTRTVPCPDTGHPTPLVHDWHLLKPKSGKRIIAEPIVDKQKGTWTVRIREIGRGANQLNQPPHPTYGNGKGISLFTNLVIPADYIKAVAQQGKMGSALYAVAIKTPSGLEFRPPEQTDLLALEYAERELERLRPHWERDGIIPTEEYPIVSSDERPRLYGMPRWADMFSPRQLLAMGVLIEELRKLRLEIVNTENEMGEAIVHLLALCLDKLADYNAMASIWHPSRGVIAHVFNKHDYSFKATFSEMASCVAGAGLEWAIENVIEAYEKLAKLVGESKKPVHVNMGSATNLMRLDDKSITAVVVDPPYADNVQYSELADFFYVWLKRTQGHRRPEWFSTYLCDHDEEAVVNVSRWRNGDQPSGEARKKANEFYQDMMSDIFKEAYRVLRDDGVLTVMFTHKKQEAWVALFESLISAGFTITATFPVQTESQHSLHQARKNAAQSTVLLPARKRDPNAGIGYFDSSMEAEIRQAAQRTAERLRNEGLKAVDQLVGAFGPSIEVFSRYAEVRTDTGQRFGVADAIGLASEAVAEWRIEQLSKRGFDDVDSESRFVLLCWDVLGAVEFRFNEAMLLGRAVGIDVDNLLTAGLVSKSSDKIRILTAKERRRERAIRDISEQLELFGNTGKKRKRIERKVHPQDEFFASAIDMCHALALRHAESGGGQAGIGAARGMALQQGWNSDSPCALLMEALVKAAPDAVKFAGKGRNKTMADEFPEFRAWRDMLKPLFGINPPEWKEPVVVQPSLLNLDEEDENNEESEESDE